MGGLIRSALVMLLASSVALPLGAADLSSLAPGASATIAYPDLGTPLVGGVASVTIGLPANFNRDKSYGIYLWYNGGGGGAGTDDTFSFPERQICLSLPLFRRSASDPSPPDLAHETAKDPAGLHLEQVDWYKNWIALEAVLADLHKVAPHIDPELSYCGGYSNGGHLVGFMAAHSAAFCSQFKGYLFVEGGYDGFAEPQHRQVPHRVGPGDLRRRRREVLGQ